MLPSHQKTYFHRFMRTETKEVKFGREDEVAVYYMEVVQIHLLYGGKEQVG